MGREPKAVNNSSQYNQQENIMAVLFSRQIASYDDSIQPTGDTALQGFPPMPHFKMKKLHHDLALQIDGPAGSDVTNCLNQAGTAALIAAVIAAAATGGAAAQAAFSAGSAALTNCLGNQFAVSLQDHSYWVEWWT